MKQSIFLGVIIVALIVLYAYFTDNNHVILPLIGCFLFALYMNEKHRRRKADDTVKPSAMTVDELTAQYGEPEDVILLDATRGNEAMGVILVYKNFLVVEGRRLDKSAITDVTFNNSGTPYARDEYQVIIATNIPEIGYIHVKAGYDVAWTKGVAEEIRKNLAEVFSNKK